MTAQLDMLHQQTNGLRSELMDETAAFNRDRDMAERKIRSLEMELAESKQSMQSVSEAHAREAREWTQEKEGLKSQNTTLQTRADKSQELLFESDRRIHSLQGQLQHKHDEVNDKTSQICVLEERIRKAEEAQTVAKDQLVSQLRRAEAERYGLRRSIDKRMRHAMLSLMHARAARISSSDQPHRAHDVAERSWRRS